MENEENKPNLCCLSSEELNWIKSHVELDKLWTQRKSKVVEALLVWAAIGVASATVTAIFKLLA